MINNSYRTNTGVDRNNRLWNGSAKGGYKWFEPSKYGLNQNYSSPNNVSLFPEDDKKIGLNSESTRKIDTKNSSISLGSAASIRNRLSTNSRYGEAKDYLSLVSDEELEKNYRLTKEAYDVAKIKNNFFPYNDSYPDAMAASISLRDLGNKEGEKLLYSIAHTSINTEPQKATSQAVQNTSSTVDTSIFDLSNTNNPSSSKNTNNKTEDSHNRNNSAKMNKYSGEEIRTNRQHQDISNNNDAETVSFEDFVQSRDAYMPIKDTEVTPIIAMELLMDMKNYFSFDGTEYERDQLWNNKNIMGWELCQIAQDTATANIMVYSKKIDDQTHYAIVNAGSSVSLATRENINETGSDWANNFVQLFGLSEDMKKSKAFAEEFVKQHPNDNVVFVGYSKGGAEASVNAVATNKPAIVFNPATANFAAYGLDYKDYESEIHKYVVDGETLNYVFSDLFSAKGDETILNEDNQTKKFVRNLCKFFPISFVTAFILSLPKHSLESVYNALNSYEDAENKADSR